MNTNPTRILVVDDEPDVLSTLSEILQHYGYAVVSAPVGEDAVEIASLFKPDVLITDYSLPDIDGVTTLRRVREQCPRTRALLVSGYISEGTRKRAEVAEVDHVFEKPLSVPDLLKAINAPPRRRGDSAMAN